MYAGPTMGGWRPLSADRTDKGDVRLHDDQSVEAFVKNVRKLRQIQVA